MSLIIFDYYLTANVGSFESIMLHYLVIFIFFGTLFYVWRSLTSNFVYCRISTWFLIFFWIYFSFRIAFDLDSFDTLKAYTVATSGGIILFYILGMIVGNILDQHINYALRTKNYIQHFTIFFIIYLIVTLAFQINTYYVAISNLRSDIFLIKDNDAMYQRPGDYIVISFLIMLSIYVLYLSITHQKKYFLKRIADFIIFSLIFIHALLLMFLSQIIGSNKGTVVIAGIIITFYSGYLIITKNSGILLRFYKNFNIASILKIGFLYKFVVFSTAILSLFAAIIFSISWLIQVDLTLTRLGGYGSLDFSSMSSRVALINSFSTHFAWDPFFGDMNVDCKTTGCGSYIHSFFGSLLTHTGLIGFFTMCVYIFLALKELTKKRFINPKLENKKVLTIINLYYMLSFLFILFFATIGTFITWSVIWFSMGLFFKAIIFRKKNEQFTY